MRGSYSLVTFADSLMEHALLLRLGSSVRRNACYQIFAVPSSTCGALRQCWRISSVGPRFVPNARHYPRKHPVMTADREWDAEVQIPHGRLCERLPSRVCVVTVTLSRRLGTGFRESGCGALRQMRRRSESNQIRRERPVHTGQGHCRP